MPGVTKHHTKRDYGRAFPASRYDDPRGGRASALERNILRYRAIEVTVYLFYADEVRDFTLTDVHSASGCFAGCASAKAGMAMMRLNDAVAIFPAKYFPAHLVLRFAAPASVQGPADCPVGPAPPANPARRRRAQPGLLGRSSRANAP